MRVLNTEQMREADRRTIEDVGIPSLVLMENAGRQVVAAMEASFEDLRASRHSLMPEGQLKPMTDQQIRDLFAYLRASQPLPE